MLRKKGNDDNMADEVLVPNILLGTGEPESEQNSQFFVTRQNQQARTEASPRHGKQQMLDAIKTSLKSNYNSRLVKNNVNLIYSGKKKSQKLKFNDAFGADDDDRN